MKVLIVDDSKTMRRIVNNTISELEPEVSEAGNGVEAMSTLDSDPNFDIILLDWNMPEMNGIDTLKAIRANEATKGIPVVMVTTEAEKANVVAAIQSGANQYVTKPFQPEVLIGKIKQVLG